MSRDTETVKNSLRQSVGAGFSALGGSSNYFVLEHVTDSAKHRSGEKEEVIVNYVEIGRDPRCAVRFSESEKTVSRKHAAIQKEGNNYVLVQLSKTNPTILNGRPVNKKWYLQNGDQIQLSAEGPKLNFLTPQNNKSGSIGFTRRLSLFGKQALRPYKTAVTILAVLFLLSASGGGYAIYSLNTASTTFAKKIAEYEKAIADAQLQRDSLATRLADTQDLNAQKIAELNQKIGQMRPPNPSGGGQTANMSKSQALSELHKDIYYIVGSKLEFTDPAGSKYTENYAWSGTGFLTETGEFVTARHVVEPWYYPDDQDQLNLILNVMATNGGSVKATIFAASPEGEELEFSTEDFKVNRADDETEIVEIAPGEEVMLQHAWNSAHDWAYVKVKKPGSLVMDKDLSLRVPQGEDLELFGYPLGQGVSAQGLSPLYAKTSNSQTGVDSDGFIKTTTLSFDHGNSGGPVFYNENGEYKVVGIVSGSVGNAVGRFVPVAALQ